MKKYLLLSLISLACLSGNAQTTFVYSGSATNNFLAGGPAKISAVGDNTTIFLSPSFYHIGLAGVANNGFLGNIGVFGTTKQHTIGSASSHFAIYGDNSSNNINANNINVTGGFFTAKNIGTGTTITGVSANSTGSNNSSTTYGVNAIATNNSNTTANKTIGVRGESVSGNTTTNNYLYAVTNPGGYFTGDDGQGLYGTTTDGYILSSFGKVSQGVTGYSNLTGAYMNAGVVGYAEGTGNFKVGVYGNLNGTAATSVSSAIYGTDNINTSSTYAGYFLGKVSMNSSLYVGGTAQVAGTLFASGGLTTTGTKNFTIDHPLDPENKILRHASIESNEVLNQYSGNITTDSKGNATVTLPKYFEVLNKDFRYQLTVMGSFAQAIIKKEVSNNQFVIKSNRPNVKVSWQITGVRNDRNMQYAPFVAETEKEEKNKGKYMSPEAYGKPKSQGEMVADNVHGEVKNSGNETDKK
jgi:hypothetical protein